MYNLSNEINFYPLSIYNTMKEYDQRFNDLCRDDQESQVELFRRFKEGEISLTIYYEERDRLSEIFHEERARIVYETRKELWDVLGGNKL